MFVICLLLDDVVCGGRRFVVVDGDGIRFVVVCSGSRFDVVVVGSGSRFVVVGGGGSRFDLSPRVLVYAETVMIVCCLVVKLFPV